MKKIIFAIIVLVALVYLGVIRITNDTANTKVKQTIGKGIEYTKQVVVSVFDGVQNTQDITTKIPVQRK